MNNKTPEQPTTEENEEAIEHRLTKPSHPWTNGQVERMNRTLKDATVRRYHYDTHRQLGEHLAAFLEAYNSPSGSRPFEGSRPTNASATRGPTTRLASDTIQPTSFRD